MQKQVSDTTKRQYLGQQARLICFLYEFHSDDGDIINHDFFKRPDVISEGKVQYDAVKETLKQDFDKEDFSCCPLHLKNLKAEVVGECIDWINEKHVAKGREKNGVDAVKNFLAAVKDLFRTYSCLVSPEYQMQIDKLPTAYASDIASNCEKNHPGKALPFELYCDIGRQTLQVNSADSIFARTFLIIQWNLMCRAEKMENIMLEHLNWNGDFLEVYFRKQENDRKRSRGEVLRHVYANPVKPEVCAVLALGIFFLSSARRDPSGKLFLGNSQATRFGNAFRKILESMSEKMKDRGLNPSDFGSRSSREGSIAFVTASSTLDGPSQAAVNLRCGRTISKDEKSYLSSGRAGDQFVGRTVAGLPLHSLQFAMLPPMFREKTREDKEFVEEAMRVCFPFLANAERAFFLIAKFGLASVVYHSKWLLDTLPKDHVLLQSGLFAGNLLNRLRDLVVCEIAGESDAPKATGVPQEIMTHLLIERLQQQQTKFRNDLSDFRTSVEKMLDCGMNNHALSQGDLTVDTIKGLLSAQLESFCQRFLKGRHEPESQRPDVQKSMESVVQPTSYYWGGGIHPVPESFSFTSKMPVRQAFIQWTVGNHSLGYPPFRLLNPNDMPNPKLRKMFSNLKQVMMRMERKAKEDGVWPLDDSGREKDVLDIVEATSMLEHVEKSIGLAETTPKGRVRRSSEIAWITIYASTWRKTTLAKGEKRPRKRNVDDASDSDSEGADESVIPSEDHDDGEGNCDSAAPVAPDDVPAGARLPNFDVQTAYKALIKYCAEKLNLVEGERVPGDGSCFFYVVSRKLRELGIVKEAAEIRRECVDWVMSNIAPHSDADALVDLDYADWEDWAEKMRQMSHYADELCFQAVTNVYNVSMLLILATATVSHRVLEPDIPASRTIIVACVGDHHCYDFVSDPKKQSRSKNLTHLVTPVRKQARKK